MQLFLEKNVPTSPSKWAYWKGQAKKKFDVYPSWARCISKSGRKKQRSKSILKILFLCQRIVPS